MALISLRTCSMWTKTKFNPTNPIIEHTVTSINSKYFGLPPNFPNYFISWDLQRLHVVLTSDQQSLHRPALSSSSCSARWSWNLPETRAGRVRVVAYEMRPFPRPQRPTAPIPPGPRTPGRALWVAPRSCLKQEEGSTCQSHKWRYRSGSLLKGEERIVLKMSGQTRRVFEVIRFANCSSSKRMRWQIRKREGKKKGNRTPPLPNFSAQGTRRQLYHFFFKGKKGRD